MTSAIEHTRSYYQGKIQALGPSPAGVDWGSAQAQLTRFEQLLKLVPPHAWANRPSLNDLGCGYGALLGHLEAQGLHADYLGIDVVPSMVEAARQQFGELGRFEVGSHCPRVADYGVASGLFNVRNNASPSDWQAFIFGVLDDLNAHSRLGFAFNCLTSYSDADHMRPNLYYGDPLQYFDLCKRKYARNVALLHDYDLYDFTIIVRKDAALERTPGEGIPK
jgi:SAM-dependent methyltransferase